jgi:two-component system, OmpR family, alkaline phosphatase synthesis response regulator PhoP
MKRFKVLVVDDEPFICRSLSFVLRKDDYEVFEARDGQEALEVIRAERPDLVFLDVMMPKMNGFDVVREVRRDADLAGIQIVLLTAKGQDADRQTGEAAGADDYMTKPFSPTKILERARKMLDRE